MRNYLYFIKNNYNFLYTHYMFIHIYLNISTYMIVEYKIKFFIENYLRILNYFHQNHLISKQIFREYKITFAFEFISFYF